MCTEGRGQVCKEWVGQVCGEGCRGGAEGQHVGCSHGLLLLVEILKTREDLSRLP